MPSGSSDMKQDDKVGFLAMAMKETLVRSVAARQRLTGTITITVEVNLSQGGIGQSYLSEHFRQRIGG